MMLMCIREKPLWISGKEMIMGSVFFVLKGLFICLREGSMEVNWPRIIYIGQKKFCGYGINANCKINE